MLYNPTPRKPSLADLEQWLMRHDPAETYWYNNPKECLAAQYNESIGRIYELPPSGTFNRQLENIASQFPRTFGGALERTKAMRASRWQRFLGWWR